MFSNPLFGKTPAPPSNQSDAYSFPPVLQSFLNSNSPSSKAGMSSDRAPLITETDSTGDPTATTSLFSRRSFFSFSTPADNEPAAFRGLTRSQRLLYFGISAVCASLFFCLALIFIPLLATPSGMRKFVFMYLLGNVALVFALAFAYGPWAYAKSLMTREKLPANAVYFGSLFLGVYGVLWWRSTLCALLAVGIQIGLGIWQLKQFVWSGTKIFSFLNKASALRPGGGGVAGGSGLPI